MMMPDTLRGLKQHDEIPGTFTGSGIPPGPLVELSCEVLNMEKSGIHGRSSDLLTFRSKLLPNCKVEFLDSQVNGAVFMLQKTYGQIPIDTDSQNRTKVAVHITVASEKYPIKNGLCCSLL